MAGAPKGPMERHHCNCGNHVWTNLTKGFVLLVSPEDEEILDRRWTISTCRKSRLYVSVHRSGPSREKPRRSEKIHRAILKPGDGMMVDHINLNSLDNRRENIRACTPQQNLLNRPAYRGKKVPLKGVQQTKQGGFKAVIRLNGQNKHLGHFKTAEEAHLAFCKAAKEAHGEFFRPDILDQSFARNRGAE